MGAGGRKAPTDRRRFLISNASLESVQPSVPRPHTALPLAMRVPIEIPRIQPLAAPAGRRPTIEVSRRVRGPPSGSCTFGHRPFRSYRSDSGSSTDCTTPTERIRPHRAPPSSTFKFFVPGRRPRTLRLPRPPRQRDIDRSWSNLEPLTPLEPRTRAS